MIMKLLAPGQIHNGARTDMAPEWIHMVPGWIHMAPGWMYDLMSDKYITIKDTKGVRKANLS